MMANTRMRPNTKNDVAIEVKYRHGRQHAQAVPTKYVSGGLLRRGGWPCMNRAADPRLRRTCRVVGEVLRRRV